MGRLVQVATKETVERLLAPQELFQSWNIYQFDEYSEMVHFVFENGTDVDILKLGEIVNSKQQHAKKVRDGLQALYKAYQGTVKNEDTWSGLISRRRIARRRALQDGATLFSEILTHHVITLHIATNITTKISTWRKLCYVPPVSQCHGNREGALPARPWRTSSRH